MNGEVGQMIVFDTEKEEFVNIVLFLNLGSGACCVWFEDKVHIFGGTKNYEDEITYDINTTAVSAAKDCFYGCQIISQEIGVYENCIVRIGGMYYNDAFNSEQHRNIDEFVILCDECMKRCALPVGLSGFGWIIWKDFLLMFGGWNLNEAQYKDEILWVDLRNIGYYTDVKCRLKSNYEAEVLENGIIHLFSIIRFQLNCFQVNVVY